MNDSIPEIRVDADRLLSRLRQLGEIGRDQEGRLIRLAASDADKLARDQLVAWLREAELEVLVDRVGNIFGVWSVTSDLAPLMMGSHIDTVIDAGIYDGSFGVLAALATIESCRHADYMPDRSMIVAAFTNEEGVRFVPDMMGSLVYAGGMGATEALAAVGTDGLTLGDELERIGYRGEMEPGSIVPSAFLETHIEQGPLLESAGLAVGAVENLQGISWQRVIIEGAANHAGTTPIAYRRDAGLAAARVITFVRDQLARQQTVATVGTLKLVPSAINIIPARAELTIDLRDPSESTLRTREDQLREFLRSVESNESVSIVTERLVRFEPVQFDAALVEHIESSAQARRFSCRRMTSGAGHDAQMMARICPTAMLFVPSRDGISHSPHEYTADEHLVAGAQVLLDTAIRLTSR